MEQNETPQAELNAEECLSRLSSQVLGRLVVWVGDVVDIFPVNYVVDGGDIVLRTAEGTKFAQLVIGREVLFEADHYDHIEAWSVVVRGSARELDTEAEIAHAETLPLRPMVPTLKRNFVRLTPRQLTGRHFVLGEEPSRDGPQDY